MSTNIYDFFAEMEKEYILQKNIAKQINEIGEVESIRETRRILGILTAGSRQERELHGEKNTAKNMKIFRTKTGDIAVDDIIIDDATAHRVVYVEGVGMGEVEHFKIFLEHYE